MYQDKANRKRRSGRAGSRGPAPQPEPSASHGLSDVEIQRAASGIV